ncbi:MAG: IS110 family transposase [Gemmatimonadota bacterium]
MRFYTGQHQHYCGIDLHARTLYLCVLDAEGNVLLHKNLPCDRQIFLETVEPFRDDLVVASECIFNWYWLADLCAEHDIHFVLGHALYMRAIHGAKAKNDKIDSLKTASLLRGGLLPQAYAYPAKMRPTRDLLRRRTYFVRKRGQLTAHIQNTFHQYNLPRPPGLFVYKCQRAPIPDAFADPIVHKTVEADLALCETYDTLIRDLEKTVLAQARIQDPNALLCLNTIPGIGKVLSFTFLYEIHDISRFDSVQRFASYARLIKCEKSSASKRTWSSGPKIGNAHLKWAFGEAAVTVLSHFPECKQLHSRLKRKFGNGKALSILAHKIGRTVYFMLKRNQAFDPDRFLANA